MLRLLLARVRRDRVILPVWIAATALLAYAGASGVKVEFPTDAEREAVMSVAIATPSLLALRGLPDGATLGAYVFFQVFCYLAVMAGLMSTFLVARHTRADEERGRLELLGAAPIRRTTNLVATLVLGAAANAVLGVLVALGLIGGGLEPLGSWAAGAATGATGLAFLGIAALAAQLAPTSRSANGIGAAAVGAAFLLRAVGDALGTPDLPALTVTSAWPSWLSPIGWGQHVFASTRHDLTPLLLSLALAVAAAGIALAAQSSRDLGSSLLPERAGRADGRIRSSLGLAWRQQWPSLIGWTIGGALTGAIAGAVGGRIADAGELAQTLQELLSSFVPGGRGQLIDLLVAAVVAIAGILAAAAGAQAIMRARGEESDGRIELVLAAPVRRVSWLLGYVLVAVASVVGVSLAAGLAAGASFLSTDAERFWPSVLAGVAQIPAGLAFVALTTLVFAVLPRLTVPVGWAAIAVGFMIGQFGGLLRIPDGVRDASPFRHTPAIPPVDGADWSGAFWLVGISVAVLAVSAVLVRTRQLTA
jgi:ABC-2 type transport system permease protein